ncbi:hypothetical protein [Kocuria rosea]|uniref:hypothetical protein n=1 Tax=Kocuria rosea TaxID=1275 RepID=UPI000F6E96CB|nr:hypothetical protein [Kocuria rosea]MEB2526608.1 hypothetical protein [Kocuria rosea]VEI51040.1 Uncharacterised protein [Kocuria rosea]
MTAGKTWAATGATAAMLAGGLLLGAPAAVAAPGDPACLQATAQLDAALAGAGLTPESLGALDLSAEAVAVAEAQYAALVEGAGGPSLQELEAAAAALMAAQESGDAEAVALAEARLVELDQQLTIALGTLDPAVAEQAVAEAAVAFEALLAELALDESAVDQFLVLLEQAVLACEAPAAPAPVAPVLPAPAEPAPAPVEAAPVEAAPVVAAPVEAAPVEVPAETAPVEVNPGLNMQTAVAEPEQRPGAGLAAGLLAAGIAASAAGALRLRRRSRS